MKIRVSDELLQRYFDDELSAVERADVASRLEPDDQLRLEALAELRGLLRAGAADEAARVDFSTMVQGVERAGGAAPARARRWRLPLSAAGGLLAAAAALVLFLRPVAPGQVQSAADVETLEVEGALATVFDIDDGPDRATVIFTDELPEGDTL